MTALAGDDRAAAAAALGELGDKAAAPELEKLLAAGKAAPESARGLAALGDRGKAVAATRKLLAGDAAQKRAGALAAAGIVDAELLAPLQSAMAGGSESLKIEILDELALAPKTSRAEVHKLLVRALSDVSPRVRARAVELLVADGDKGVKGRLVDLLGDADAGVRAVAAAALVRVAGASSLDELARAARDKSPQVRAALAAALVVHPVEGAGKLAAKLDGDGDPQVHKALAAAREQAKTRGAAPSRDQLADRLLHTTNLYDGLRAAADWLASPSLRADAKSR